MLILLSSSFSVIGLVAAPMAILVTWFVIARAGVWPEGLGFAFGLGLISLQLWWVNGDYQGGCYQGIVLGSGGRTSCGGFPPVPLLVAGMILSVGALLGFELVRRESRHRLRIATERHYERFGETNRSVRFRHLSRKR